MVYIYHVYIYIYRTDIYIYIAMTGCPKTFRQNSTKSKQVPHQSASQGRGCSWVPMGPRAALQARSASIHAEVGGLKNDVLVGSSHLVSGL